MASLAADLQLALDPAQLLVRAGIIPDDWQLTILRERPMRALLLCCRQSGKTLTTAAAALHEALYDPGSLTLIIAPSQRQSAELLRQVRMLLNALGPTVATSSESATGIEVANGSRIVSLPAKEATIRGYSKVSLLALDEAARIPDEIYTAVRPMLAVSEGRLIALSTPSGQRGWFYYAWQSNEDWRRIKITASQCPRIPADFLAEERRTLSQAAYGSEYECRFTDAADAVFAYADVMAALDDTIIPLFDRAW